MNPSSRIKRPRTAASSKRAAGSKTIGIDGKPLVLTVTQEELERVFDLQGSLWLQARCALNFALKLDERIRCGARIEPGRYLWDAELTMVSVQEQK